MFPSIPGVRPTKNGKPLLVLAQDIDFAPYAYLSSPPEGNYEVAGFGFDFANGMAKICNIEIQTVETKWKNCWYSDGKGNAALGVGLQDGWFHACNVYTYTAGVRDRDAEFSYPIIAS